MQEKRLTRRLTTYWEKIKKDKSLPEFQQWNSASVDDVWAQCMLLKLEPGSSSNLRFEYAGAKLKEVYGKDMTGQVVSTKMKQSVGSGIIKKIPEVVQTAEPLNENGQFVNDKHKIVKYRSCILPFGNQNGVTHIIVGLSWKAL